MRRGAAWALAAAVAFALPVAAREAPAARAAVEVAFAPDDDIAGMLVRRIGAARQGVRMQAYLFTDRRIANALLAALKRGVEVEVIGDGAQHDAGGLPFLAALHRAGARVYLDRAHAAMHNKILIVDGEARGATVITGSYNFTPSAQSRNAENVVVLSGNRALTRRFVAHFEHQRQRSTPWPASTSLP